MNILLVESDDIMRSLFQAALERDGFHVMAVKDNQEGLVASGAMPFDVEDLAWGGHVLLDACRDAAKERRLHALPVALNGQSP